METLLWAADLVALVFLCVWALRQDMAEEKAAAEREQQAGRDGK